MRALLRLSYFVLFLSFVGLGLAEPVHELPPTTSLKSLGAPDPKNQIFSVAVEQLWVLCPGENNTYTPAFYTQSQGHVVLYKGNTTDKGEQCRKEGWARVNLINPQTNALTGPTCCMEEKFISYLRYYHPPQVVSQQGNFTLPVSQPVAPAKAVLNKGSFDLNFPALNQGISVFCPLAGGGYKTEFWQRGTPVQLDAPKDKNRNFCPGRHQINEFLGLENSQAKLGKTCCVSFNPFVNEEDPYEAQTKEAQHLAELPAPRPEIVQEAPIPPQAPKKKPNNPVRPPVQVPVNPPENPVVPLPQFRNFQDWAQRQTPLLDSIGNYFCQRRYVSDKKKGSVKRFYQGAKACESSSGHCYMHVKLILKEMSKKKGVRCWYNEEKEGNGQVSAKDAGSDLKKLGYTLIGSQFSNRISEAAAGSQKLLGVPVNFSPVSAPNGSVIVYNNCPNPNRKPGEADPGHIELKLSSGFVSDMRYPLSSLSGCKGYSIYIKKGCSE